MTIHPPANWQGQQLGRYHLVRQLGRGNTCEVWLADDTQSHRQVAVKLLPPVAVTDTSYLQTFTHMAHTIGTLKHPNVLALHDFGEHPIAGDKVVAYLVMSYVPTGTLQNRIRNANGLLPVEESMHYLKQAAQAIDYAHSQQIVHGDIKPANMLLHQGQLLLADFGIAKLLASLKYQHQTFTVGLERRSSNGELTRRRKTWLAQEKRRSKQSYATPILATISRILSKRSTSSQAHSQGKTFRVLAGISS